MEQLQYDINTYLTSVKMSSKVRVLVEGCDDKAHISNIISMLCRGVKFKVDMAANIKGICQATSKNNRAKVERAHQLVKGDASFRRLLFLCDREDRGFTVGNSIRDEIGGHYVDGQLSWTMGHSFENYFLNPDLLGEGLRYLTSSAYKSDATFLFIRNFDSTIRLIAVLTLAARSFGNVSYPCGVIGWRNLEIDSDGRVSINFESIKNPVIAQFEKEFRKYELCVSSSELDVCVQLCRGHTGRLQVLSATRLLK